MIIIEVGLKN